MFNIAEGGRDYPISKNLQDEMFNKQIRGEGFFSKGYSGLGVFLDGDGNNLSFSHDGRNEGFISRMVAYPKLKKAFIIMINHDTAFNLMNEITNGIADTYNLPGFEKIAKKSIDYSESDYPNIQGYYKNNEYVLKIISKNNTLYLRDDNFKSEKRLYKGVNKRFFVLEENLEIEYLPESNEIKIHFPGTTDEVDTLMKSAGNDNG